MYTKSKSICQTFTKQPGSQMIPLLPSTFFQEIYKHKNLDSTFSFGGRETDVGAGRGPEGSGSSADSTLGK